MVQKAITGYYDLLDKRLKEGTSIILIISFLIFCVGLLSMDGNAYKSNIHEYNTVTTISENSIITIDGKRYKVVLEEIEE